MEQIDLRPVQPVWLYDNEDIEPWLVEEHIGYFDVEGYFHYVEENRRGADSKTPKQGGHQ